MKKKKIGEKLVYAIGRFLKVFTMGAVIVTTTVGSAVPVFQSVLMLIIRTTNFGGQTPKAIDIILMIGLPTVFIMGMVFYGLTKLYKYTWRKLGLLLDKKQGEDIK